MTEQSVTYAQNLDREDPLREFKDRFNIPRVDGKPCRYFCGNSLGLSPKDAARLVNAELNDWAQYGVLGHTEKPNGWLAYHELVLEPLARIAGAKPSEVIAMNSLTTNLHLLMVSFYRPTPERSKILIEKGAFPSDIYAVKSQIAFHGFDPNTTLIEVGSGETPISRATLLDAIEQNGQAVALVLLGQVNYLTGQAFDVREITRLAHAKGCVMGLDLAHGIGNLELRLHDDDVDFAVWCHYKYMNGGPGTIAGAFVHERHADFSGPRFEGWWGHRKADRFAMRPDFVPIRGAEGWQLSNPPILQLSALRASLALFDEAGGMAELRRKSVRLTGFLADLLKKHREIVEIITPEQDRGCQLSLRFLKDPRRWHQDLEEQGMICDFREPDIVRVAPVPLYNSFEDVARFAEVLA